MVQLSLASSCSQAGCPRRAAAQPCGIASCLFSEKPRQAQNASFFFGSPHEPFTSSFNILSSALLLKQSVSLRREREYKYLAQVDVYFSVFMDAESIVPVWNVSGEA